MVKISSQDTNDSLTFTMMAVLTPEFAKGATTKIKQMLKGIAEVFKINISQINEHYNDTFIISSEGDKLDDLIVDISGIRRKNGETDANYRTRYYKYIFTYNGTKAGINEAVYDITGEYPVQLLESNKRTMYWGQEDLPLIDQIEGTAQYYSDVFLNAPFWGDYNSTNGFIGYIYLASTPTTEQMNELIDVLNYIKAYGVKIYIVVNETDETPPDTPIFDANDNVTYTSFRANWGDDPTVDYWIVSLYDSDDNPISTNKVASTYNHTFTGLDNSLGVPQGSEFRVNTYNMTLYSVRNNIQSLLATSSDFNLPSLITPSNILIQNNEELSFRVRFDALPDFTLDNGGISGEGYEITVYDDTDTLIDTITNPIFDTTTFYVDVV